MQICTEGFRQVKREMEEIQKNIIISLPAAYFIAINSQRNAC